MYLVGDVYIYAVYNIHFMYKPFAVNTFVINIPSSGGAWGGYNRHPIRNP